MSATSTIVRVAILGRWVEYERKAAACPARAILRSNGDVCDGESKWSCKYISEHNLLGVSTLTAGTSVHGTQPNASTVPVWKQTYLGKGVAVFLGIPRSLVCRCRADGSIQNAGLVASSPPGQVRLRLLHSQRCSKRRRSCENGKSPSASVRHIGRYYCSKCGGAGTAMRQMDRRRQWHDVWRTSNHANWTDMLILIMMPAGLFFVESQSADPWLQVFGCCFCLNHGVALIIHM